VLEAVSGRGYAEAITERILEPLGMSSTHPVITYETRRRQAVGYAPLRGDQPHVPRGPLVPGAWVETATGDGCIASTAGDVAAYVRMLLNRGRGVLSAEGWDLLTTPTSEETDGTPYAYGLNVHTDGTIGHGGSTIGFQAEILADPAAGVGAVVLLNGPGPDVEIVEHALTATVHILRSESVPELRRTEIDRAAFAGLYSARGRTAEVVRHDGGLAVTLDAATHPLHARGEDAFVTDHPGLADYVVRFQRRDGAVTGFSYGPDVFTSGDEGSVEEAVASELCGHYRSHNPWYSNLRIVARRGELLLIWGWGEEEVLEKIGEDRYRVGGGPDVVVFDPPLAGAVRRVRFLGGGDYYRTFT
jgi:D-alanyl-D-alanine carboxypeptidase